MAKHSLSLLEVDRETLHALADELEFTGNSALKKFHEKVLLAQQKAEEMDQQHEEHQEEAERKQGERLELERMWDATQ